MTHNTELIARVSHFEDGPIRLMALFAAVSLDLSVFLPIAGVSINIGLLVSVGMVIGFLSGLLGVGGGFLTTPILMMLGIPPIVAAASDTNAIVATSASGVAAQAVLRADHNPALALRRDFMRSSLWH